MNEIHRYESRTGTANVPVGLLNRNCIDLDDFDMSKRNSTMYRARSGSEKLHYGNLMESYEMLPSLMRGIMDKNPGSNCSLQVDMNGRFFRCFVALGGSVRAQEHLVPVMQCDATHMKSPYYNGVCIVLFGRGADGRNFLLALALVHKETKQNYAWFWLICHVAGLDVGSTKCMFVDRGK